MEIEEPMQIGELNTMLTVNEKARRRAKGLCFYCGKEGHYISYCPIRPPRSKHNHVGARCHHPTSPSWPLFCSTLHATGPKRPPNQTNGTITALANPAPFPEPQEEAPFQSSASISPKVSCSNTEGLSPDCVIASNGTVVRRQDINAFEQALKARAASPSRLLASTAFSDDHNLKNVPTLS
ncbi:Retrotransposon-derived PEG10 [Pelobates cultripes]|uniref:Retrotransposon-derived PEG10 n=1 Tax=Pelobates cultripes TaxID=61616 RepID=A0AAD1QYN0_PELCU|nr:Retrotransposon-derived PEG10 [Pelobates cultripes]